SRGYYLFSNIPYDSSTPGNNQYVIGIPSSNFDYGQPLYQLRSSTGGPSSSTYVNPSSANGDRNDNGIDPVTPGLEVLSASFTLQPSTEPTGETDLSSNNRDGPSGRRRGVNGEQDNSSDLTIDFGFFGGADMPFSLGNFVWKDDGYGSGESSANDGIWQSTERPVEGVLVRLYRDGNGNGQADSGERIRTDITDANGFYLFDNLDPGTYIVEIPASEFAAGKPLDGWHSSVPTFSNDADDYDKGINTDTPETDGVFSNPTVLTRGVDTPTGETHVSGQADPDSNPATPNLGINPTEWDGPASMGRYGETDTTSNLTVDFGFIPPFSLGNRVWLDNGAGGGGGNNGVRDGTEPGIAGVTVNLYRDSDNNGTPDGAVFATTTTDTDGYYRFDNLIPDIYIVEVVTPDSYASSTVDAGDADVDTDDDDDNGVFVSGGTVRSHPVQLGPMGNEPLGETNPTPNPQPGEAEDAYSNRTVDFGFTPLFSLGNRVWFDTNNDSLINGTEVGVGGVTVQLFAADGTEIPVGPDGILGTADDASGGVVTDADGYYRFDRLYPGDYIVGIPYSEFNGGGLSGYWSSGTYFDTAGQLSETTAALANSDIDSDDNGNLQFTGPLLNGVASSVVTLGPSETSEPLSEADLGPGGQGQPDGQANMTVDFGFYTLRLGDLVWLDSDNSGTLNGTEGGVAYVDIELWSADGTKLIHTTRTNSSGNYSISGLPAGDYIVRIPHTEFEGTEALRDFRSSTGGSTEPAPDADLVLTDSDDNGYEANGVLGLGGYIQTQVVTLTPGAEQTSDDATGQTTELRVDFGVYSGPQVDLAITKTNSVDYYVAGGTIDYEVVVTNNGPANVTDIHVSDSMPSQLSSWTWTCDVATPTTVNCTDGTASPFTDDVDLLYGESVTYHVSAQILATASGVLDNTARVEAPSGYTETDTSNNTDTESDQPAEVTVTKDDSVSIVSPGAVLTYHIVIENTGGTDLADLTVTDTLPADVTFQNAYQGSTPVPPSSVVGNVLTWTSSSIPGLANLVVGDSISFDVVARVNDTPAGSSITNEVTVRDNTSGASGQDTDTDNLATTEIKSLTGTSEADSGSAPPAAPADPEEVFIGEILTYTVHLNVPAGTMYNLKALDVMDPGLAFVRCVSITPGTLTTDLAGGFAAACDSTPASTNPLVSAEPASSTDTADQGRRVSFDLGNVTSTADETLEIVYEAIVLDVASNVDGVSNLNNHIDWTWNTSSKLSGEATPVTITEPKMEIVKTANPNVAVYGTPIDFTLDISHATSSTATAYDVIMTDVLPTGLGYVTGSVVTSGLAPTSFTYDPTTATLRFVWNVFPVGQSASIAFKATFIGPSPVVNAASLEWTSLEIDPSLTPPGPVQRSTHNIHSTERWYDPTALAPNNYHAAASAVLTLPEDELPSTGFAPGEMTRLPAQPAEKAYAGLGDVWLEIPRLGLSMPVTGVPLVDGGWDLTWLSNQAGYLEGTTYPGQVGTSGITGHLTLADGTPGPFHDLDTLSWGDLVILHMQGERYVYELRQLRTVSTADFSIFENDGYTWLTLLTCNDYIPWRKAYASRTVVRAVLISIEADRPEELVP
ncbi:MAG: sortase, partial [Chloroflexi bacterium]|nr:sortase [Chloroflexota bacterium]